MKFQLNCLALILIFVSSYYSVTAQTRKTTRKPVPATTQKKTEPEQKPEEEPLIPEGGIPTPPPRIPSLSEPVGTIILLPLDDRPACEQFAKMIGSIGEQLVISPPADLLGRFTTPGNPERIREWLGEPSLETRRKLSTGGENPAASPIDYSKVNALVVSVDMLVYGGLIASRTNETKLNDALERLEFFRWFRKAYPNIPVYAFSTIMRVAPTASKSTRLWRNDLERWSELSDRAEKSKDPNLAAELSELTKKLGRHTIDEYMGARRRNLQVNLALLKLYEEKIIDTLMFLQDDAREFGPHRHEQLILSERIKSLGFQDEVPIYNGADEAALSLVSRAALEGGKKSLKISVVYSSPNSLKIVAPYEDHPLEHTVASQIAASGATLTADPATADYILYINAPGTSAAEFESFSQAMVSDLKAGKKVALADLLFPAPHKSGADERLVQLLVKEKLVSKLLGFAAWNTAGNTLGTVIPAANMKVYAGVIPDAAQRQPRSLQAWSEFLLNRFAGDYLYHDKVRLEINEELTRPPAVPTDELPDESLGRTEKKIVERMKPLIESFFKENLLGQVVGTETVDGKIQELKVSEMVINKIALPWPRTFELAIFLKSKIEK